MLIPFALRAGPQACLQAVCTRVLAHLHRVLARRLAYSHRALADNSPCLQARAFLFASRYSYRYLLHDRDTKFTHAFDALLKASGVAPVVLPPRSPNLHAHCERFVRAIKEEALEQMLMLGERSLHAIIREYMVHDHQERNHQGLRNRLIAPEPGVGHLAGQVGRWERLSGLLSYYHREAA